MKHPDRKLAKCYDMPGRSAAFTDGSLAAAALQ